ncbi:N-ethylmaleimide reductase [Devosia sp. YR412]|uniref:alkene reductase n=1 Tax=Devosia sp. YR412 TaxID=1881030 RepID=UPI0008D5C73F|nr:alkene reductase [Devosia sp. YR412]SEP67356.1 N-ethylmaleimide reductase [Devosia sp. YR412]
MTAPSQPLFDPFTLGPLDLPNRLVMAPMTRRRAADGKLPTALMAQYYAQRASAGLIVSESIEVDPLSGLTAPTRPGLFNGKQQSAWRQVTDAVHAAGGRIFAQLSHMGRGAHSSQLESGGRVVGPSAIAATGSIYTATVPLPYEVPHALSEDEIAAIVAQYGEAARLAKDAGFDGVELHGANGYLIDQFLRDASNQRDDRYGGSAERRARFLLDIIAAAKAHWPGQKIGVRVSPTNNFQGMSDSDPVAHYGVIATLLDREGLAYLHLVEPATQPEGLPQVAPTIRQAFTGPLILAAKYDLVSAQAVLAEGRADLVAFGELFLANPDLPERLKRGAPLNPADKATFYTEGERGYTDYPFLV